MTIEEIEATLAELLETYAEMRSKYIRPVEPLARHDEDLALEVAAYEQAAYLLRHHREETAGMGLPAWLWDDWAAKEQELSTRLKGVAPLGYVVLAHYPGQEPYQPSGVIHDAPAGAEAEAADRGSGQSGLWRYTVAELREIPEPPRGCDLQERETDQGKRVQSSSGKEC